MSLNLLDVAKALNISISNLSFELAKIGYSFSDSQDVLPDFVLINLNKKYGCSLPLSTDNTTWWEQIFNDTKIFIDTCAYLKNGFPIFFEKAIPFLKQYKNRIIIPVAVKNELEKKANQNSDEKLRDTAKNTIRYIESYKNYFKIQGEQNENFADNVFLTVFTKFRIQYNMVLISCDSHLCKDITLLNNQKSVNCHPIQVSWLEQNGFLRPFSLSSPKGNMPQKKYISPQKYKQSMFSYPCKYAGNDQIINIQDIPVEYNSVITPQGPINLLEKIGEGGEGCVYKTNTPYIAKIYLPKKLTLHKQKKIELMINNRLKYPGICFPIESLSNSSNQFIGYLMPEATGKEIQSCMFKKPVFFSNFPSWKKNDMVRLCISILKKIQYLHANNIIIGDINPRNILVNSPTDVILVDTDSYQIEGYPCPVGTINFTAPEIMGKNFTQFLRTKENEYFAIATLLFMLMLPGKPPYSQQGGGSPEENIKGMDFSYPLGENSNKKTPEGPWRFIWSHLPYFLKEKFYQTFRKNEIHAFPENRINVDEWLKTFEEYSRLLTNGTLEQNDWQSLELFPTRLKKRQDVKYQFCRFCHEEKPENALQDGVCWNCNNAIVDKKKCERCGTEIEITRIQATKQKPDRRVLCHNCIDYLKQVYKRKYCEYCNQPFDITNEMHENLEYDPIYCKDCNAILNQVYTQKFCKTCGQLFEITLKEHYFYEKNNWNDPIRCKSCRKQKNQ